MECDVGPPAEWVPTGTVCSPIGPPVNQCNAATGTCVPLEVTGTATATGDYFQYASFNSANSGFIGGYDVGSYGDLIYVNRSGTYLDVYQVELLDSDGDSLIEPHQHPDNPNNMGPVEQRVLSWVTTYVIPELGPPSISEVYPLADRVYFITGSSTISSICEYVFATGVTTTFTLGSPLMEYSFLGYGEVDGLFYVGEEAGRIVYSLDPSIEDWVAEFEFPPLAGGYFGGLEVVVDPNTGIQYVYVADYLSSFLGQYRRDLILGWVQENVFHYTGIGKEVQGMGFGALNHFWFTTGTELYEMGGGDLTPYVE